MIHEDDGIVDKIKKLGITPYKIVTEPKFNWEKVLSYTTK